jgi:hypothetical protein
LGTGALVTPPGDSRASGATIYRAHTTTGGARGDITPAEGEQKIEWAISQHLLWGVWRDPKQLQPELQQDIPFIIASKTYNAGVSKRTTYMQIMDVGLVFGQPKVALTLTTCDITPNRNIPSKKPPKMARHGSLTLHFSARIFSDCNAI